MRRHALDREVRRTAGGRLLSGGMPPRLIRLSAAGSSALDSLLAGKRGERTDDLRGRLCGYGFLHPVADEATAAVEFVVPVRDGGENLPALVAALLAWGPVTVVDDGSADGSAERAGAAGATVLRNERAPGPAGARNTGLAAGEAEFVAFIDADCVCNADWARPLAALLAEDPTLALVAPRVRSASGEGALPRYERSHSPLDLGPHPALVGRHRRIAYLPSAALVGRRSALLALEGFDEDLRFGEDVDLTWRLTAGGWTARYAPESTVEHRPRPNLAAFARQRFEYGSSAAALDARHPGAVAPLRVNSAAAIPWGLAAAGARLGAAAVAAHTLLAASRQPDREMATAVATLALRGHLQAGRQLARAISREWLPVAALACLTSRRARRLTACAIAVDLVASLPGLPRPTDVPLHLVDRAAYSLGLWHSAVRSRSARTLIPTPRR